jgi:hypothetical protein
MRRRPLSLFGKMETTLVRRRICLLRFSNCSRASSRLGALKMARMSAATGRRMVSLGTSAWAFCWRWNWQRCQGLDGKTVLSAALSPSWASRVMDFGRERPRSLRLKCRSGHLHIWGRRRGGRFPQWVWCARLGFVRRVVWWLC